MKYLIVAFAFFTVSFAKAEEGIVKAKMPVSVVFKKYVSSTNQLDNLENLKVQYARNRRMRTGGIIMMSVGAGLFVAGEVMLFTSLALNLSGQRNYQSSEQDPLWDAGLACSLAGAGGVVGGLPLYIIGNRKSRAYNRRINALKSGESGIIIK